MPQKEFTPPEDTPKEITEILQKLKTEERDFVGFIRMIHRALPILNRVVPELLEKYEKGMTLNEILEEKITQELIKTAEDMKKW